MIEIRLPIPPSTNNLYVNRRGGKGFGRFKSKAYREWIASADQWFLAQRRKLECTHISGPCKVLIRLPKIRGDVSNRIKAPEDWLVSRLLTSDDKNNVDVQAKIDASLTSGFCVVEVRSAE